MHRKTSEYSQSQNESKLLLLLSENHKKCHIKLTAGQIHTQQMLANCLPKVDTAV